MKRYAQYCPVAHALELVGERWVLLIVRDLLNGPRRYTDLLGGLPGIGTNILATRLRDLEEAGVIRKEKLPPPAASTVYELTEYGRELEEAIHALGRWGARSLGPPPHDCPLPEEWLVGGARAMFDPIAAAGISELYEVRSGDEVASIRIDHGRIEASTGPAVDPDAVIELEPGSLFRLASRELSPADAVAWGLVRVDGDQAALERFITAFNFERRDHAADDRSALAVARGGSRELAGAAARTR
ncbi:MAG: winged helix-turn-helix transcriptional regulator [Actinomycetota bacterium]|nr:winged helix-turn-helix transcriptional regulator [Actinomycetota bacterium]